MFLLGGLVGLLIVFAIVYIIYSCAKRKAASAEPPNEEPEAVEDPPFAARQSMTLTVNQLAANGLAPADMSVMEESRVEGHLNFGGLDKEDEIESDMELQAMQKPYVPSEHDSDE